MPQIRPVQLLLTTLNLVLAIIVLGTASHVLSTYQKQQALNNPWWLPLFAQTFNTTNVKVFIGIGASILLLNLFYLVASFVPKISQSLHHPFCALLTIGITVPSIILAVTAIIVDSLANRSSSNTETIKAWTCRYRHVEADNGLQGTVPRDQSNASFDTLCGEALFAFWGTVLILILEVCVLISALVSLKIPKSVTQKEEEKSVSDVDMTTPTKSFMG